MGLSILTLVVAVLAIYVLKIALQKWVLIQRAMGVSGDWPGKSILWLHPFRSAAIALAPYFPFAGRIGYYYGGFSLYRKHGSTCLSSVVFWDSIPTFWFADADAIRAISTTRPAFQKDTVAYEAINIYGENMVGLEGSDWRRHRAIAKPAFNEANHALVWVETQRVVDQWFAQIDQSNGDIDVDLGTTLTRITLLVISSAGFGRRSSWAEESRAMPPPGHKVDFNTAVTSAMRNIVPKAATPKWVYTLSDTIPIPWVTPLLRETTESFDALGVHMLEMVSLARAWVSGGKTGHMDAALLGNLVEANMVEENDAAYRQLTDDELLSNTFTFLLAGHETSAHSLCFAIALLALHPEVQDKVYEEVMRVWPPDSAPLVRPLAHRRSTTDHLQGYKDSKTQLEYTAAVFNETLRLFPPVARLGKLVHTDTVIQARRFAASSPHGKVHDVEQFPVELKAGSIAIVDIFGVHLNPIHWGADCNEFKPERFIDTPEYRWPRDAFLAFSAGPRSCIGQRFALAESICILANVVRRYEICVPAHLLLQPRAEQERVLLAGAPVRLLCPLGRRWYFGAGVVLEHN
ncbi:cytochrome P450 [Infundibulicybe gibba]|nr:cytochrome P450 [Infundibulicybe gibba]